MTNTIICAVGQHVFIRGDMSGTEYVVEEVREWRGMVQDYVLLNLQRTGGNIQAHDMLEPVPVHFTLSQDEKTIILRLLARPLLDAHKDIEIAREAFGGDILKPYYDRADALRSLMVRLSRVPVVEVED